jgi:hypothetical protein
MSWYSEQDAHLQRSHFGGGVSFFAAFEAKSVAPGVTLVTSR